MGTYIEELENRCYELESKLTSALTNISYIQLEAIHKTPKIIDCYLKFDIPNFNKSKLPDSSNILFHVCTIYKTKIDEKEYWYVEYKNDTKLKLDINLKEEDVLKCMMTHIGLNNITIIQPDLQGVDDD